MFTPVNESHMLHLHFFSPGQALVLQLRSRVALPGQSAPPLEGGGLLHVRCLVRVPPPQVCEQADQLPKGPHCPSTVANKYGIN